MIDLESIMTAVLFAVVAAFSFVQGMFFERQRRARHVVSVWRDRDTGETCVKYQDGHIEKHANL